MDLADAHRRALEGLGNGTASQAINLGTGQGHACGPCSRPSTASAGRKVPFEEAPRRAGDPPELVAAPGRARDVLGWSCRYAALDVIVEHAWKWHAGRV